MSEWKPKRFWKAATVTELAGEWTVHLDGRAVKTPAKAELLVPTRTLAEAIAAEWAAQEDEINPLTMPYTRMSNAAIDKVRVQKAEVASLLADYADSDLLCYRAEAPEGLVARQAAGWDPYLDWAAGTLGARLVPVTGLMHAPQPKEALAQLSERTHAMTAFQLAAFHDLVSLTGSIVLGFAATHGFGAPQDIWNISRIDEIWQIEQWGADEEAYDVAERKKAEFLHAASFWGALAPASEKSAHNAGV